MRVGSLLAALPAPTPAMQAYATSAPAGLSTSKKGGEVVH